MKTSYELAMERLSKAAPSVKLTAGQRKELAELDSRYAAKIAEREISMADEIEKMAVSGDAEKTAELRQQLIRERKALQADLEEKKEKVRSAKA